MKEYLAGTDPNNAASFFHVSAITAAPPAVAMCVLSVTNRIYSLQWQTDLVSGLWNDVTGQTNVAGNGSPLWLTDTNSLSPSFHKVSVRPAP